MSTVAIVRTQRSELFQRVVLDRPPLLAPIGFVCEEPQVIEPVHTSAPRPARPTLSYLERASTRRD